MIHHYYPNSPTPQSAFEFVTRAWRDATYKRDYTPDHRAEPTHWEEIWSKSGNPTWGTLFEDYNPLATEDI